MAGITEQQRNAFATRFQGGLRAAAYDIDGDGYNDLITVAGAVPSGLKNPLAPKQSMASVFGDATSVVTIYNGAPVGSRTWTSSTFNMASLFPGYSGGFLVTVGDVLGESSGSGNGVAEIMVSPTDFMVGKNKLANNVAVLNVQVASRGAQPAIASTGILLAVPGRVTGLAAGDFTNDVSSLSDIVVATTTATTQLAVNNPTAAGTAAVHVFAAQGNFTNSRWFTIDSRVQNGPPPTARIVNAFLNGASLAVGDLDNAIDQKPDLLLGVGASGLGNFRVLTNALVASGTQAAISTALQPTALRGNTSSGKWQPTGGPDYFTGFAVPMPIGMGFNAPLSVAVVEPNGKEFKAAVFAAIGTGTQSGNQIRSFVWGDPQNQQAPGWGFIGILDVVPSLSKTRFPINSGLRLG